MPSMETPGDLGRHYGNEMYEMTRRRLSSQFMPSRRSIRRSFAGRKGSGLGLAMSDLYADEARTIADASTQAVLAGTRLGEDVRQFNEGLASRERMMREGWAHESREGEAMRDLQMKMLMQRLGLSREQLDYSKDQDLLRLLGGLGQGAGDILSLFL